MPPEKLSLYRTLCAALSVLYDKIKNKGGEKCRTEGDAEIGNGIDAISGATVTSKAIARSVNSAVGFVTGADTSSGATSWGG